MPSSVRVTILGSGTSQGVPMIGCTCQVCRSTDPRDKRTRSSIYIDDGETPFLVDTTPEMRVQCLANDVANVQAVLFTHPHADHIFGFDDLRRFCDMNQAPLPIYGSAPTLALLEKVYSYAFDPSLTFPGYVQVRPHPFLSDQPFSIGSLTVWPLEVEHGKVLTHGFLFERAGKKLFAYIPDCKALPRTAQERLRGTETILIDGLRSEPIPTHMSTGEAIAAGQAAGAARIILTHLTHHKSHADREAELPPGCHVAYDGMQWVV